MIDAYLTDKVVVKRKTLDKWQEATISSSTIPARIEHKNRLVRDFNGDQVASMTKIIVKDTTINPDDEIEINSKDYGILNILEQKDFSNKYLEIYLG